MTYACACIACPLWTGQMISIDFIPAPSFNALTRCIAGHLAPKTSQNYERPQNGTRRVSLVSQTQSESLSRCLVQKTSSNLGARRNHLVLLGTIFLLCNQCPQWPWIVWLKKLARHSETSETEIIELASWPMSWLKLFDLIVNYDYDIIMFGPGKPRITFGDIAVSWHRYAPLLWIQVSFGRRGPLWLPNQSFHRRACASCTQPGRGFGVQDVSYVNDWRFDHLHEHRGKRLWPFSQIQLTDLTGKIKRTREEIPPGKAHNNLFLVYIIPFSKSVPWQKPASSSCSWHWKALEWQTETILQRWLGLQSLGPRGHTAVGPWNGPWFVVSNRGPNRSRRTPARKAA